MNELLKRINRNCELAKESSERTKLALARFDKAMGKMKEEFEKEIVVLHVAVALVTVS